MLQVPLVCAQQLAASSDTAAVVAADESTGLAHCYKLVSTPAATAASKLVNSVCSSTRITLQGEVRRPGVLLPRALAPKCLLKLSCAECSPDPTVLLTRRLNKRCCHTKQMAEHCHTRQHSTS